MNKGLVTKIIEFSFVDGPGNRMAIFMQGCNFNCGYCHNPETINQCNHCGACVSACKSGALKISNHKVAHREDLCINCDQCVAICPHSSTPKAHYYSTEELFNKISSVKDFIQGITISGGECTLQWQFIKELFAKVKSQTNLTTFIDSNGYISETALDNLIGVTDGFMLDIKGVSNEIHSSITEQPNNLVLRSIEMIHAAKKLYELRYVVIPNVNDGTDEIAKLASLVRGLDVNQRLILIPFRNFGVKGRYKDLDSPSEEDMVNMEDDLKGQGLTNIVNKATL